MLHGKSSSRRPTRPEAGEKESKRTGVDPASQIGLPRNEADSGSLNPYDGSDIPELSRQRCVRTDGSNSPIARREGRSTSRPRANSSVFTHRVAGDPGSHFYSVMQRCHAEFVHEPCMVIIMRAVKRSDRRDLVPTRGRLESDEKEPYTDARRRQSTAFPAAKSHFLRPREGSDP